MKKIIFLLFIAAVTITANTGQAATWTNGNQVVKAVIWRPDYHGFYVDAANFHDPEGCQTTSGQNVYLIDLNFETQNVKTTDRLYALMLLAHSTGKKLHVFVDGCVGQSPKIIGLQIN